MLNHDVVFRSEEGSEVSAIGSDAVGGFEVDRIDDAMSEGWSVLASGTIKPICATDQLQKVIALGIEPWAGGERWTYFRVVVTGLSGRRIVTVP